MAKASIRLAAVWSLIGLVAAQGGTTDPNNRFIYPPPGGQSINENATIYSANINITYGVEQRQSFQWTTDWDLGLNVYLWQEGPPNSVKNVELVECQSDASFGGSFYWDGDIGAIDLDNGTIAFLITYQCNGSVSSNSPFFYSHYFNLTAPVARTTTTTTMTATATPTPTSTKPLDASGTPNANGSGNTTSTDGGSSNAAALGGGIGGGIGGALLLIAAGFFFFYWRRKHRNNTAQATTSFTPVSQNPNAGNSPGYFPANGGAAYGQQTYKYDPQQPPLRAELGGQSGEGGAYGYYDGREYKPNTQHSPSGRLPELGA